MNMLTHKICTKCHTDKKLTEFFVDKRLLSGRVAECKQCYKNRIKLTRTPEYKSQVQARWLASEKGRQYKRNAKERAIAQRNKATQQRLAALKQVTTSEVIAWRKAHAKRNIAVLNATPRWVDAEHKQRITEIYALTQQLQEVTAAIYHVDHIVPLNSDVVCGLQVWWNLQPLLESANVSKGNKFLPLLYPEQDRVAFPKGDGPYVTGIVTQTKIMESMND